MAKAATVLVVEDDVLIAMMIEDIVTELGLHMIGPVISVAEAEHSARTAAFDIAIVDVSIKGGYAYSVADILAERGIPFVFSTGHVAPTFALAHRDRPILIKPYTAAQLEAQLLRLLPTNQSRV